MNHELRALTRITLYKAHATENDFVVVIDRDGLLQIDADTVATVCDRRAGIGADGLIRMVPTARAELTEQERQVSGPLSGEWFMDYRNADGSIAEMCGNGVRAMVECGVAADVFIPGRTITVATRGGDKVVQVGAGRHRVEMGWPEAAGTVAVAGRGISATGNYYLVPNPHLVVQTERLQELDLPHTPEQMHDYALEPALPNGVNIEFVEPVADGTANSADGAHVRMRVAERGVGETRSCGTGCVAVGFDTFLTTGKNDVQVDIPGGTVTVTIDEAAHTTYLDGPATVVAKLKLQPQR